MENKKFGALSSSENPQQLADTVKGAIKLLGGLIVYFGYASLTGDVNTVADQVGTAVTLGVSFYGAVMTLYGLLKKVAVKLSQ
jgi:hypothetical protein